MLNNNDNWTSPSLCCATYQAMLTIALSGVLVLLHNDPLAERESRNYGMRYKTARKKIAVHQIKLPRSVTSI